MAGSSTADPLDPEQVLAIGGGRSWLDGGDPGPGAVEVVARPAKELPHWRELQANGGQYRKVPLVRVDDRVVEIGERRYGRRILLGDVLIAVGERVTLTVRLDEGGWFDGEHGWEWRDIPDLFDELGVLGADWAEVEDHGEPDRDPAALATRLAKALAERTRNEVAELRRLRLEVEGHLSARLRPSAQHGGPSGPEAVASLIELARAASAARAKCREAAREGLLLWVSDSAAYHQHRAAVDSSVLPRPELRGRDQPPWLATHDAGVRHMRVAVEELTEEIAEIYGLLDGASTIASMLEAEAQERLNGIAAAVAVGLGVPGLFLALFGADALLPGTDSDPQEANPFIALAIILAGSAVAGVLAFVSRPERRPWIVAVVVALVLVLLAVAALKVPF